MSTPVLEARTEKKVSRSRGGGGGVGGAAKSTNNAIKLKAAIRRLPPAMTEVEFKEHTAQWIDYDNIEYFSFNLGKIYEDRSKGFKHALAWVRFKSHEPMIALQDGLQGRIFTDSKGNQSRPQLQLAPFQKIPKKNQKHDLRQGTIDQDPEFIAFLDILKSGAPLQAASTLPTVAASVAGVDSTIAGGNSQDKDKPTTTPLIDYLRAQKAASANSAEKPSSKREKDGLSRREKQEKRLAEKKAKLAAKNAAEKEREKEKEKAGKTERVVKLAVRVANAESAAAASRKSKASQETASAQSVTEKAFSLLDTGVTGPNVTPVATMTTPSGSTTTGGKEGTTNAKPSRRERGSATIAAAILQRDLGLGGPLQRKDRSKGGQLSSVAPEVKTIGGESGAPAASSDLGSNNSIEKAPSEQSQSPSKSSRHRGGRNRNRGGQNVTSGLGENTSAAAALKAPISILKKQDSTAGNSGNNPPPLTPQILKRESTLTSDALPTTVPKTAVAPPEAGSNQVPASPAKAHPPSPIGPRTGRGGRPFLRGHIRGNNANNAATQINSEDKSPKGPQMGRTSNVEAASSPGEALTTAPKPSTAPAGNAGNAGNTGNTGQVPGVAGNVPSGPSASARAGGGMHGGRGGHFGRGGPRGGGFPPRGRGGRGRGGGSGSGVGTGGGNPNAS